MRDLRFFFKDDVLTVSSDEVYNFGYWAGELFVSAIKPRSFDNEYRRLIPKSSYLSPLSSSLFQNAFINWLKTGEGYLIIKKEKVTLKTLQLNTLLHLGNDVFRFMARVFGQADFYLFAEGKNRPWLANIIDEGVKKKILKRNMGWEDLHAKLLKDKTEPVILSYQNDFPSHKIIADYQAKHYSFSKNDIIKWKRLTEDEQRNECLSLLRKEKDLCEICPETWKSFRYEPDYNGFDLLDYAEHSHL